MQSTHISAKCISSQDHDHIRVLSEVLHSEYATFVTAASNSDHVAIFCEFCEINGPSLALVVSSDAERSHLSGTDFRGSLRVEAAAELQATLRRIFATDHHASRDAVDATGFPTPSFTARATSVSADSFVRTTRLPCAWLWPSEPQCTAHIAYFTALDSRARGYSRPFALAHLSRSCRMTGGSLTPQLLRAQHRVINALRVASKEVFARELTGRVAAMALFWAQCVEGSADSASYYAVWPRIAAAVGSSVPAELLTLCSRFEGLIPGAVVDAARAVAQRTLAPGSVPERQGLPSTPKVAVDDEIPLPTRHDVLRVVVPGLDESLVQCLLGGGEATMATYRANHPPHLHPVLASTLLGLRPDRFNPTELPRNLALLMDMRPAVIAVAAQLRSMQRGSALAVTGASMMSRVPLGPLVAGVGPREELLLHNPLVLMLGGHPFFVLDTAQNLHDILHASVQTPSPVPLPFTNSASQKPLHLSSVAKPSDVGPNCNAAAPLLTSRVGDFVGLLAAAPGDPFASYFAPSDVEHSLRPGASSSLAQRSRPVVYVPGVAPAESTGLSGTDLSTAMRLSRINANVTESVLPDRSSGMEDDATFTFPTMDQGGSGGAEVLPLLRCPSADSQPLLKMFVRLYTSFPWGKSLLFAVLSGTPVLVVSDCSCRSAIDLTRRITSSVACVTPGFFTAPGADVLPWFGRATPSLFNSPSSPRLPRQSSMGAVSPMENSNDQRSAPASPFIAQGPARSSTPTDDRPSIPTLSFGSLTGLKNYDHPKLDLADISRYAAVGCSISAICDHTPQPANALSVTKCCRAALSSAETVAVAAPRFASHVAILHMQDMSYWGPSYDCDDASLRPDAPQPVLRQHFQTMSAMLHQRNEISKFKKADVTRLPPVTDLSDGSVLHAKSFPAVKGPPPDFGSNRDITAARGTLEEGDHSAQSSPASQGSLPQQSASHATLPAAEASGVKVKGIARSRLSAAAQAQASNRSDLNSVTAFATAVADDPKVRELFLLTLHARLAKLGTAAKLILCGAVTDLLTPPRSGLIPTTVCGINDNGILASLYSVHDHPIVAHFVRLLLRQISASSTDMTEQLASRTADVDVSLVENTSAISGGSASKDGPFGLYFRIPSSSRYSFRPGTLLSETPGETVAMAALR